MGGERFDNMEGEGRSDPKIEFLRIGTRVPIFLSAT